MPDDPVTPDQAAVMVTIRDDGQATLRIHDTIAHPQVAAMLREIADQLDNGWTPDEHQDTEAR